MDTVSVNGITFSYDTGLNALVPLTRCCKSVVTGTEDGIACRVCYTLVDEAYADCVWTPEGMYKLIVEIKGRKYPTGHSIFTRIDEAHAKMFG